MDRSLNGERVVDRPISVSEIAMEMGYRLSHGRSLSAGLWLPSTTRDTARSRRGTTSGCTEMLDWNPSTRALCEPT